MNDNEIPIRLPNNKHSELILIEEYNGITSLVLANEGRDGQIWKKWSFPQLKGKKPAETAIPLKIPLGNRDDARQVSKQIAEAFGWIVTEPGKQAQKPVTIDNMEEIPF